MDHTDAVTFRLAEQYLLEDMPAQLRDEFEEHFFDCEECAADLRMTAAFLDAARVEMQASEVRVAHVPRRPIPIKVRGSFPLTWKPYLAFSALAASLLVIVYQDAFVYPGMRHELAELKRPEIVSTVSLIGGNSRGGGIPSAIVTGAALLLTLDIPTQDRFSSYTCLLYSSSGELIWTVRVSAEQAQDTVSIQVPEGGQMHGRYSLLVRGQTAGDQDSSGSGKLPQNGVDLAKYSFELVSPSSNAGH